jgi:hypothetical protein
MAATAAYLVLIPQSINAAGTGEGAKAALIPSKGVPLPVHLHRFTTTNLPLRGVFSYSCSRAAAALVAPRVTSSNKCA